MNQERNQKILLTQGAFWAAFDGLTAVFLSAYALVLGASNTVIGFIAAIPYVAFLLTQLPGVNLSQHFSRKKLYVIVSLISRLCWVGILAAPFITENPLALVIIFYLLVRLAVGLTSPSINTLLADIVEKMKRGDFFSKRFRLISFFGMSTMLIGGFWLRQFPEESITGFVIMFGIGTIFGIMSTLSVAWLKEPEYKDHDHHTIKEFFTPKGDFRRFIKYNVFFSFAYNIASPLFVVYILKTLDAGYVWYAVMAATTTFAKVISAKKVGKLTDMFGDKPVTILGMIGTAIAPFLFLGVTHNTLWLIIPLGLISGTSWAAVDIAKYNYLLGLTTPEKEGMQIAEYNFFNSIPLAIAPWIGGMISESIFFMAGIPFVFIISGILRMASGLIFLRLPEPRSEREYSPGYVFREVIHLHHPKTQIEPITEKNINGNR